MFNKDKSGIVVLSFVLYYKIEILYAINTRKRKPS